MNSLVLRLFFSYIAFIIISMYFYNSISHYPTMLSILSWRQVEGKILGTEITYVGSKSSCQERVTYGYSINNISYVSNKIDVMFSDENGFNPCIFVNGFEQGQRVQIHVNPKNQKLSYLFAFPRFTLIVDSFVIVFLIFFMSHIRKYRKDLTKSKIRHG